MNQWTRKCHSKEKECSGNSNPEKLIDLIPVQIVNCVKWCLSNVNFWIHLHLLTEISIESSLTVTFCHVVTASSPILTIKQAVGPRAPWQAFVSAASWSCAWKQGKYRCIKSDTIFIFSIWASFAHLCLGYFWQNNIEIWRDDEVSKFCLLKVLHGTIWAWQYRPQG